MAPLKGRNFPDFILIDGRYWVACAFESARPANASQTTAGLMFDDYAMRPFYHVVEEFLGSPQIVGRAAIFHVESQLELPAIVDKWLQDSA